MAGLPAAGWQGGKPNSPQIRLLPAVAQGYQPFDRFGELIDQRSHGPIHGWPSHAILPSGPIMNA
jgi:hypothetical protein